MDGVGWTLLPVDANGAPLAPAMIWLDRRAQAETDWLNALPDADRLIDLDANPIDAAYITPKLLWLKQHAPEVFEQAHRFLTASGFIAAQADRRVHLRLHPSLWLSLLRHGARMLGRGRGAADRRAAGEAAAPVPLHRNRRQADATPPPNKPAYAAGIPVIAGCLDAASGALGAGVTRLGQTNEQGGQAGGFAVSVDHVVVEPQLIFSHHVIPGQYLLQAGTVGGGSLGWFRDLLGSRRRLFEALSAAGGGQPRPTV